MVAEHEAEEVAHLMATRKQRDRGRKVMESQYCLQGQVPMT
jgi:hypothetical protein